MSYTYFCKLKPLGEYFLGGDRTFDHIDSNNPTKSNYFIHSENTPSQATILGMIRFLVLKKKGLLSTKGDNVDEAIGKTGFTIEPNDGYGLIKKISTVLIYNQDNQPIIKTPLNHKNSNKEKFNPIELTNQGTTDLGDRTLLPIDYKAKDGLADNYVNSGKIVSVDEIFIGNSHSRVAKNRDEDSFFKKEYKYMQDGYYLGFYLNIDEELPNDIVYLGQEKSAFSIEFSDSTIDEAEIDANSIKSNNTYFYALSDVYIPDGTQISEYIDYCIINKKPYRFFTNGKKSQRYQFIAAGSVFYVNNEGEFNKIINNEHFTKIGFNKIIKIGE